MDRVPKWFVVLLSVTSYCCMFSRHICNQIVACYTLATRYSSVASADEAHLHAAREERISQTSYNFQFIGVSYLKCPDVSVLTGIVDT